MHKRASAMRTMAAAMVAALAASTGACGSGDRSPPPNCLQVAPCGGDIVGTWSFLGTCTDLATLNDQIGDSCPGAAFNAFGVALSGTFTFNADLTYTASNWREDFVFAETLPLMCAGAASCAEANGTETQSTAGSTTTVTTTCTGTSTCSCRINGRFTVSSDAGTWATAGSDLTMYGSSTSTSLAYCVEENRLHMIGTSTTATGQSARISDIVAIRSQ